MTGRPWRAQRMPCSLVSSDGRRPCVLSPASLDGYGTLAGVSGASSHAWEPYAQSHCPPTRAVVARWGLRRSALMQQPCPHCDQLDTSLLRLVLIGEILSATEDRLVLLAEVM